MRRKRTNATRRSQRKLVLESLESRLPLAGVTIPTNLEGAASGLITVPILIDDAQGMESADIELSYDAARLSISDTRLGNLAYTSPISSFNTTTPGKIIIGLGDAVALGAGGGSLVELDFVIDGSVTVDTSTDIDLISVSLNEGGLGVSPQPAAGQDATDGLITFAQRTVSLLGGVSLEEGDAGTTAFTFDLQLSHNSTQAVTVEVSTADGSAAAGTDFNALNGQVVTFAASEVSSSVMVEVTGDVDSEPDEDFFVSLANAIGAQIGIGQATGTILNDDTAQAATLDLTLVTSVTTTAANGEIESLPGGLNWLDEWTQYEVEVWVSTPDSTNVGVARVSFELSYDASYFTAAEVSEGPAFDIDVTTSVDESRGAVEFDGSISLTDVGDDQFVLAARVSFVPVASGAGVPHSRGADYIDPVAADWLFLQMAEVELHEIGQAVSTSNPLNSGELWAAGYDIDDDGQVGFGDLAFLGTAFQQNVGDAGASFAGATDFDHSGTVDFGDVAFFASNFGRAASDGAGPLVYPSDFPAAWRDFQVQSVQQGGNVEQQLMHDGFHFGTLIETPEDAIIFRPHPDQDDPNGWGSSLYINPFLAGAEPGGGQVDEIVTKQDGVEIHASGRVNRDGGTFGTWNWQLQLNYAPDTETIIGSNGELEITLDDELSVAAADLNIYRLASSYLHDVDLKTGGVGDTGDIKHVQVTYAPVADPRDFLWIPPNQPQHFPQDLTRYLSIRAEGDIHLADPLDVTPHKPTLQVVLESLDVDLIAGLCWDDGSCSADGIDKTQDFSQDNVGITPLVLNSTTAKTRLRFRFTIESTPPSV